MGLNFEIVKVSAAEDDSGIGWGRKQVNSRRNGRVQTYTGCADGPPNGILEGQTTILRAFCIP